MGKDAYWARWEEQRALRLAEQSKRPGRSLMANVKWSPQAYRLSVCESMAVSRVRWVLALESLLRWMRGEEE